MERIQYCLHLLMRRVSLAQQTFTVRQLLLSRCLIGCMTCWLCAAVIQASNPPDLTHDGVVDSKDIDSLNNKLAGRATIDATDDLNGDGRVDVADTVFLVNLIYHGGADPARTAPALQPSVSTGFTSATQFLYTGPLAPQSGVQPGSIDKTHAAIVRGRVMNAAGAPLAGVSIRVHQHPEFGMTLSRVDGYFDLAVNGGGLLSIDYTRTGCMPTQRMVQTAWNDIAIAPDVRLLTPDSVVTTINLASTAPIQMAGSSRIQDQDGTRTGQLMIRSGTHAVMTLSDGSTRSLTTLHVRATEYTVGPGGPAAMPGPLPAESGYTYCVELSDDQALAAGAGMVSFSQPLVYFLNNFLNFPVGTDIPNGYYDRNQAHWVAGDNGEVLKVLAIVGGKADLDVNGLGLAATAQELTTRGIDGAELGQIASLYPAGATFWRVPIAHFTPWDHNWPFGPPPDATPPNNPPPKPDIPKHPKDCLGDGSIIGYRNQTLGEQIPLAGLPFNLNYRNDRVPGRTDYYNLKFDLSGTTIPDSLETIVFDATVAGRKLIENHDRGTGLTREFQWDGKNVYGQELSGAQPIAVAIHYIYPGQYYADNKAQQAAFGRALGAVGAGSGGGGGGGGGVFDVVPLRSTAQVDATQTWVGLIGNFSAKNAGLGGWTLDVHHAYDVRRLRVYLGNGDFLDGSTDLPEVIKTIAGDGDTTKVLSGQQAVKTSINRPYALAVGPDGSVYTAEGATDQNTFEKFGYCIRRITPDGIIHVVAGTGEYGFSGDGGPATSAKISQANGLAIGSDGSIYISDTFNFRVRRVWPDGTIRTIAGDGGNHINGTDAAEGVPATSTSILPVGLAVAPDGRVFVADQNDRRIFLITTDGRMWTFAGHGGTFNGVGDGGLAYTSILNIPSGVAYGPDGSVYIVDQYVRRVRPDGIIEAFAGNYGTRNISSGDGGPANVAGMQSPGAVAVGSDGIVYIQDANRIRQVTQEGIINTIAGTGQNSFGGDGGPATDAGFQPLFNGLAVGPDKALYLADYYHLRIRRVGSAYSSLQIGEHAVPSEDASEIYVFGETGEHLRTIDAWTNAVLYSFQYAQGLLTAITDGAGNITQIEHDAQGNPTAIDAPGGQRTVMTVDANGYLASVTAPGGIKYQMSSTSAGLLKTFTDPDNHTSSFSYDEKGRLTRDDDALGGFTALARSGNTTDSMITVTQPGGQTQTMETHLLPRGEERRKHTHASGAWEEVYVRQDGSSRHTDSDGTIIDTTYAPDPRWGMGAKYVQSMAMTPPGGTTATMTLQRTAVLADPNDPFSLAQQTDTATIGGQTDTTVYDAATRRFVTNTAGGRQNIKTLDAQGRVTAQQYDPALNTAVTTFTYDVKGRLQQAVRGARSWQYAYDAGNQLLSRTNANGDKVQYAHSASGRVAQITDLNGNQYGLGYNGNDDLTSITMPGGAAHKMLYDPFHSIAGYLPPGNAAYTRTFNADRSLHSAQWPDGRTRTYAFDAGGRLVSVQYPEATLRFDYQPEDDTPRVLSYNRGAGFTTQALQIDRSGELINQQQWTGPASGTMTYVYAADMQLGSSTFTHGSTSFSAAITRDNDGFPTAWGPFALTRGGPGGMPTVITDTAANWTLAYDNLARVAERRLRFGGADAFREQYTWDKVDRLATKIETVQGVTHTFDYSYDAGGRLVQVNLDGAPGELYAYDNRGNRTSSKHGAAAAVTAAYDAQDRLQTLGSTSWQFSSPGFLQSRGGDAFQYGTRGELLQATVGGQTVQYTYDGYGRRVARAIGASVSQYFYGNLDNPLQVTAAVDPAGVVSFFWYDDGGRLLAMERGGARYTIAVDQAGTPRLITDASGSAVKNMSYDSFGRLLSDSNAGFDFPFGFSGGLQDSLTGLVLLGFRDYDPETGRWTARDPALFNGGSPNLYAYCFNDPTSLMDWYGFTAIEASAYDGIGGGVKLAWDKKGFSFCAEIGFGLGSEVEVDPFAGLDKDEVSLIAKLEGKVGVLKLGGELEVHECAKFKGKLKACVGPACLSNEGPTLEADPGHGDTDLKDLFKKTTPKVGGAGAGVEGKVAGKFCFQQAY